MHINILKYVVSVKEKIAVYRYRHHNTYFVVLRFIAKRKKGAGFTCPLAINIST